MYYNQRGRVTPFQKCFNDRENINLRAKAKTNIKKKMPFSVYLQRIIIPRTACFVAGIAAGAALMGFFPEKPELECKAPALYGTPDGRACIETSEFEYTADEFIPANCGLSDELQEYTYYLCKAYSIDYNFALAVMLTESGFDVNAVSADGHDIGLMQIRDVNNEYLYKTIGITDTWDPYQNIHAGLYILRGLFEKYDSPSLVLMAYNMGERGASLLWDVGVYETNYTRDVLTSAESFAEMQNIKK